MDTKPFRTFLIGALQKFTVTSVTDARPAGGCGRRDGS